MKKIKIIFTILFFATLTQLLYYAPSYTQETISVFVQLGLRDVDACDWSGRAEVSSGEILGIQGWQFDNGDSIATKTSWKASSSRIVSGRVRTTNVMTEKDLGYGFQIVPGELFYFRKLNPIQLIINLNCPPSAVLNITTHSGSFSIKPYDLKTGTIYEALDGNASYSRVGFSTKLTEDDRHDDNPAVIVESNGDTWISWISFKYKDGDRIYLAKVEDGMVKNKIEVSDEKGDFFLVKLGLDKNGKIWVVWSENNNGNWELVGKTFARGKLSRKIQITDSEEPDIFHSLAADSEGNLWMAWQSFRYGNGDIFIKKYDGTKWSEVMPVTTFPGNDWEPKLAADSRGNVYVIWDTYRYGDYDVMMAVLDNGKVAHTIPVANTEDFEGYSTVTVDPSDRVWIAWENAGKNWGKDHPGGEGYRDGAYKKETIGKEKEGVTHGINPMEKFVETVCYVDNTFQKPYNQPGSKLPIIFKYYCGYPYLKCDAHGNVWVFYRISWGMPEGWVGGRSFWAIMGTYFNGSDWSDPCLLPNSNGGTDFRMGAALSPGGKLLITYGSDDRISGAYSFFNKTLPDRLPLIHNIYFTQLESGPTKVGLNLTDYSVKSAARQPAIDERAARHSTIINSKQYNLYYGDLHRHTEISIDGRTDGSPLDLFRYALDAAQLDFVLLTDHNFGRTRVFEHFIYKWWMTEKLEDVFKISGMLMPLFGYERSIVWPHGHRNVIRAQRGFLDIPRFTVGEGRRPQTADDDAERLWDAIAEQGGDPITIPHTSGSGMGTNWTQYPSNPEFDRLVEISQGDRSSYEALGAPKAPPRGGERFKDGFIWNALEKGAKFGFIASSDHESTHISYACVFADEFSRDAIFEAMKLRRTFAATDKIFLDVKLNGHFMGEEFTTNTKPSLQVHIIGTDVLDKVEVIKNSSYIYALSPNSPEVSFTFIDENAMPGENYYYVRVMQRDEAMAWGSPVWVTYNP